MYGYVIPDKPNLLLKEYTLYRAHYCGVCKATGRVFGQAARLLTNYDATFLSLFMYDYHALGAEFDKGGCILNPLKKKVSVKRTSLLERVTALNVLLAYHSLRDDVADGGGAGKRTALIALHGAYSKAKKRLPEADLILVKYAGKLTALEAAECPRTDEAADCFACMLGETAALLGEGAGQHAERRETLREFFYHLGRWVYIADAIDDLDEDCAAGRYNPLLREFGDFAGRQAFIAAHRRELEFYLYGSANRMAALLEKFNFTQSQNLLRNVVFYGIPNMSKKLLSARAKLKKERI
jgi:hypothetical protein